VKIKPYLKYWQMVTVRSEKESRTAWTGLLASKDRIELGRILSIYREETID